MHLMFGWTDCLTFVVWFLFVCLFVCFQMSAIPRVFTNSSETSLRYKFLARSFS